MSAKPQRALRPGPLMEWCGRAPAPRANDAWRAASLHYLHSRIGERERPHRSAVPSGELPSTKTASHAISRSAAVSSPTRGSTLSCSASACDAPCRDDRRGPPRVSSEGPKDGTH